MRCDSMRHEGESRAAANNADAGTVSTTMGATPMLDIPTATQQHSNNAARGATVRRGVARCGSVEAMTHAMISGPTGRAN